MKRAILAIVATMLLASPLAAQEINVNRAAKSDRMIVLAQAAPTTTVTPAPAATAPVAVVSGGGIAASIIEWLQVAFGSVIGLGLTALVFKGLKLLGINVTDANKSQLQAIIVNGLNDAASKAAVSLRDNKKLDIDIKSQVVADAVSYAQKHGADTIKALGLDPKSGDAVEAIKARIETALNDPATPTPAAVTPPEGIPTVNNVVVNGTKAG